MASMCAHLRTLLWKQMTVNWRRMLWLKMLISSAAFCGLMVFLHSVGMKETMVYGMMAIISTQTMVQTVIEDVAKEKEDKMQEVMQIYGISRGTYWMSHVVFYVGCFAPCLAAFISGLLTGLTDILGEANKAEGGFLFFLLLWLHLSSLVALAFGVIIKSKTVEASMGLAQLFQVVGLIAPGLLFDHVVLEVIDQPESLLLEQAGPTVGSVTLTVLLGLCLPYWGLHFFVTSVANANIAEMSGQPAQFAVAFDQLTSSPRQFPLLYQYLLLLATNAAWYSLVYFLDKREHESREDVRATATLARATPPGELIGSDAECGDPSPFSLVLAGLRKEFALQQPAPGTGDRGFGGGASVGGGWPWLRAKVFESRTQVALNDVSFEVRAGEIFGLLGHNGAGKTTLINILTGMIPATAGDARVGGHSIHTEMQAVRALTSVCPQDNPIWPEFSVREHLHFFAVCRSVPEAKLAEDIVGYCSALGLGEKLDYPCGKLSGGQKRRLWVATALLGDCKLLLMDEPTSGMDVQARRDFWVLLKGITSRERRSVIFSTHYLEEADLLADRKVVLAEGAVKALGTSQELKRRFGTGYWVNFALKAGENNGARKSRILALVGEQLARLSSQGGGVGASGAPTGTASQVQERLLVKNTHATNEHFFAVCVPWCYQEVLGPLLDVLEDNLVSLGVEHHSVEMTSLEEVFMKIGEEEGAVARSEARQQGTPAGGHKCVEDAYRKRTHTRMQQLRAMVVMRWRAFLGLPIVIHVMTVNITFVCWVFLVIGFPGYDSFGGMMTEASKEFAARVQLCTVEDVGGCEEWPGDALDAEAYASLPAPAKSAALATAPAALYRGLVGSYVAWPVARLGNFVCMQVFLHVFRIMITQLREREKGCRRLAELHGMKTCNYLMGAFLFDSAEFIVYYSAMGVLIAFYCLPFSDTSTTTGDGGASMGVWLGLVVPLSAVGSILASHTFSRLVPSEAYLGLIIFPVMMVCIVGHIYIGTNQVSSIMSSVSWEPIGDQPPTMTVNPDKLRDLYDWNLADFFVCMLFPYYQLAANAKAIMFHVLRRRLLQDAALFKIVTAAAGGPYVVPGFGDGDADATLLPPGSRLGKAPSASDLLLFRENSAFYGTVASIAFWGLMQVFFVERMGWETSTGRAILRLFGAVTGRHVPARKLVYPIHAPLKPGEAPPDKARGQEFTADEAVLAEARRVQQERLVEGAAAADACQLMGLRQRFCTAHNGEFWALNGISMGIPRGCCFGLLGPNGAGKTTALSLMVGDPSLGAPTMGGVAFQTDEGSLIEPYNVQSSSGFPELYKILGVTPQFDCLWDVLTGREHLRFFAQFSGTYWPPSATSRQCAAPDEKSRICDWGESRVARFLDEVGLLGDADKVSRSYSGGMKRKLSLALNLITSPDVAFFDEMTCGVDVAAQRVLWAKILQRPREQTMVMTTHSMVEADALCERIGILVNGSMRCLGTGMEIKEKYGNGYQLDLLVNLEKLGTDENLEGVRGDGSHVISADVVVELHAAGTGSTSRDVPSVARQSSTIETVHPDVEVPAQQLLKSLGDYEVAPRSSLQLLEAIKVSHSLAKVVIGLGHRSADEFKEAEHQALEASSEDAHTAPSGDQRAASPSHCLSPSVPLAPVSLPGPPSLNAATSVRLGKVFKWCADQEKLGNVDDYALGEPTLEQVFLKFAKQQEALAREDE